MPTYPLTPPNVPGLHSVEIRPRMSQGYQESPFTHVQRVTQWSAQSWEAHCTLPKMEIARAKPWEAFFLALQGSVGTFYLADSPLRAAMAGNASGIGYVNGASQTGDILATDGWESSVANLFKAGDWISLNNVLYRVIEDVDSDASGAAPLSIWPALRASPADDLELKYGPEARGIFRLKEAVSFEVSNDHLVDKIKFTAMEVVE